MLMRQSTVLGHLCFLHVSQNLPPVFACYTNSESVFESAVNAVYWFRRFPRVQYFATA